MANVRLFVQGNPNFNRVNVARVPTLNEFIRGPGNANFLRVLSVVFTPFGPGDADILVVPETDAQLDFPN